MKILKSEFKALKSKLEKGKFAKGETKRLYDEYCRRKQKLMRLKHLLAEIPDDSEGDQLYGLTDSSARGRKGAISSTREPALTDHSERLDVITIDDTDEEEGDVGNIVIKDVVSLNRPASFFPGNLDRPGNHR